MLNRGERREYSPNTAQDLKLIERVDLVDQPLEHLIFSETTPMIVFHQNLQLSRTSTNLGKFISYDGIL